ncbi:MAG: hypothetical protein AAGN46_04805, partial [Acidobacteriota bacterium]
APEAVDLAQAEAGNCASQPYEQRPAAARDSYSSPTNFLRCDSGEYALCYYSGADPLPCDLSTDETGDCQCQVFTASAEAPMYIEIGGILNACVYAETVEQCGANGAGCQNICTDHPSIPGCSATSTSRVAPACDYVADGTFNPAADVISTFSLATVSVPDGRGTFSIASNDANGQYAGCMTAPCTGSEIDADGNEYTTCACPLWPTDGSSADYQFGRRCHPGDDPKSPRNCDLADDQVWSAAVDASLTSAISAE